MAEQPAVTFADGNRFPMLGFGTYLIKGAAATECVSVALSTGYRHIDTAALYGNEVEVGEGIRQVALPRDEIKVTSKVWPDRFGLEETVTAFEESAAKLDVGPIDLMLLHWPWPEQGQYVDAWKALVEVQKQGRVVSIGVSNFMPDHLKRIVDETGVVPALNQIELHPRFQQSDLRAVHDEMGIVTENWSPLGHGRLLDDPVLADLASKHSKTPAQVVIRWHLQMGCKVLPKTQTPSRIAENFNVFDFALDEGDMQTLAGMDQADGRDGPNPYDFNG